jgi:Bacterial aa3 type cytochrome c oxidase subunit IV
VLSGFWHLSAAVWGDRAERHFMESRWNYEDNMANPQDIKANEQTYGGFIGMLKWVLPLLAVLTFIIIVAIQ